MPDYPPTGKRTLQDNGSWLRTLTRDDVELVRTDIDHIEPDAVVTVDGTRHEVDVIVYATGFHANEVAVADGHHRPRRRRPRASSGASDRPRTSASRCPNFPNLFCMYGPGTNLAHGGSLIFHSECQMRYITQCIEALDRRRPSDAWSPARTSYDDWHERTQAEIKTYVWSQPSIKHSFFKNPTARSTG